MRTSFRGRLGLCLSVALLCCGALKAQPQAPDSEQARPRIGLVLSGGAARGGAHIGVLKALEELRVPVDLVVGTSIGAVLGGFYAIGLSPAELEDFAANVDWDAVFANATPRALQSFRRKRDDDRFLVEQKPGLNNGEFELPVGVVQGQVIDTVLTRMTLPAAHIDDFDEFALPFRAVAGDLASGEAVVIGSGNLARVLRASMSVPAAISPIEIDGRLLADGGIAMNLPVAVAKSMGADIVIAVDITAELKEREDLRSVVDVTSQLTNLLTRRGIDEQRALLTERDVLLEPRFAEDFGATSFARVVETIPTGYELVMQRRDEFAALALDPAAYAAYRDSLRDQRVDRYPIIDFLRLRNRSRIADSVIEKRLSDIGIGQRFDFETVERGLNRVYGLQYFQNVRYTLVDENDRTGLEVELDERAWGPNYLQFGLEFDSASREDSVFGVKASYLRTAIDELGAEWRATLGAGDRPSFEFDYHKPLGADALYFIAPSVSANAGVVNVFSGDDVVTEVYVRDAFVEFGAGRELGSWGELRFGLRGGVGDTRSWVGDPAFLPPEEFRVGEMFARVSADTFDDVAFPRAGLLARAEWRGSRPSTLSADADFDQTRLDLSYAKTRGRYTVLSSLRYETTVSGQAPINAQFRIGGLMDLSGLHRDQLTGQHTARIGTSFYRRIGGQFSLFPAYAGISVELGNAWDRRADIGFDSAIFGGSLWAGVDTPIGPIYVAYGVAEGGRTSFYVVLGRVF